MYVHTHSQEVTKALYSMLKGDRMKHKSLTFSTNELHMLMFRREEEKSVYTKGTPVLSYPQADLALQG